MTRTTPPAIETRGLCRRFGETIAVQALDLRVPQGIFFGLIGRNGAGKSTTVAMLTGLLRPTAGHIALFGEAFDPDDPTTKRRLGVVTEEPSLFSRMRGGEQLCLAGQLFGLTAKEAGARAADLLALLELDGAARTLIVDYSRGMRKKLAIACALIHAPDLYFFDEPFEGIDAVSAMTIQCVLRDLTASGATVVLTTHILDIAQRLCQRVAIIDGGHCKRQLELDELGRQGKTLAEAFVEAVGGQPDAPALPLWLKAR